jgi:hypothetical protein
MCECMHTCCLQKRDHYHFEKEQEQLQKRNQLNSTQILMALIDILKNLGAPRMHMYQVIKDIIK